MISKIFNSNATIDSWKYFGNNNKKKDEVYNERIDRRLVTLKILEGYTVGDSIGLDRDR